jgi:hypothetical protein
MTDSGMLAFILRRVRASVVFLAPYDKLQRKFLKLALQVGPQHCCSAVRAGPGTLRSIVCLMQLGARVGCGVSGAAAGHGFGSGEHSR